MRHLLHVTHLVGKVSPPKRGTAHRTPHTAHRTTRPNLHKLIYP